MSGGAIFWCVVCQLCLVSGQLFFKRAMKPVGPSGPGRTALLLALGVGTQAAWFFLWIKLMEDWKLSQLYVFEGLNPAILAACAAVVLRERLPLVAWIGLGLICAGIAIVAMPG